MDQVGNRFFPRTVLHVSTTHGRNWLRLAARRSTSRIGLAPLQHPSAYVSSFGTEQNIVQFQVERFGVDRLG